MGRLGHFAIRAATPILLSGLITAPALATEIEGAQAVSLDLPRILAAFQDPNTGEQLTTSTGDFLAITAFFDTGASGVLLSRETAEELSIAPAQFGGTDIVFHDVGVGGGEAFWVSSPFNLGIKDFHGSSDVEDPTGFNYSAPANPVRVQIRQSYAPDDFFSEPIDVVGIPAMRNKVVVINPRPAEELNYINSFVYTPGTPFNPAEVDTNPGIPAVSHHVRLSYASFQDYTSTTPSGAPGPVFASNPFVGPNPLNPQAGDPPGIMTTYHLTGNAPVSTTSSFLLDTGGSLSMISEGVALNMGVYYGDSLPDGTPVLYGDDDQPIPNQFQVQLGGIGENSPIAAGFYLDKLTVPTVEGDPLIYLNAPVLVLDITLEDSEGNPFVLPGVFGMNYLMASAAPDLSEINAGAFDWLVYDDFNGTLGLALPGFVPEPGSASLVIFGAFATLRRRRRHCA
jgi:hypothetical protein